MTVAIALGTRGNNAARPLRSWVRLGTIAAILIVLASIGAAMFSGQRAVVIENPEREMAALLKDCKLTLALRPTKSVAQILPGRGGAEWYCCDLVAADCETAIEALRARVDGKNALVSSNKGDGSTDAPAWWQPHKSADLAAFEIDPPTFWIGVSKSDGKLYLRRSR